MKQPTVKDTMDLLHTIESIERKIKDLKISVLKQLSPSGRKILRLKGIIKNVNISDEDIAAAKRSLYSKARV